MPNEPETAPPLVRLHGVGKSYTEGGRVLPILEHLEGSFSDGQLTAVIGRSGSGKTTLLNLISGIDRPTEGEIHIGDTCLTGLDEARRTLFRRRHIGFIFQFFNLIPTLTVLENVLFPLELNRMADAEGRAWAVNLLERVGLAARRDTFPDRLSGGERQRVAIARALVHRPTLLLADEPTGNLDQETGRLVLELMTGLVRSEKLTMIMVTHSMAFAHQADRVHTLLRGTLVADIRKDSL